MTLDELRYVYLVQQRRIYNGDRLCDSWDGPCSCGAWHKPSEATVRLKGIKD